MSPPAPGGTSDVGRPWASLPEDLIRLVASRVLADDLRDYVRFRAVCASWLSAASPRGRGVADPRFHPRRWMMFPEGHGLRPGHPDLRGHVRFVNLDTGFLVRARLPLLGHHRAIDSVDGLLVLLRDRDTAVRLLHPFTGDVVELPPLATLLPQLAARQTTPVGPLPSIEKLSRVVCASASFSAGGAVTVMLALHQIFRIEPPVKDGMDLGSALQPPKLIATLPKGNLVSPIFMEQRYNIRKESSYGCFNARRRASFEMRLVLHAYSIIPCF
ncbi:hypothetical protein EJB05_48120, partial [Eragrostis curvula]